MALRLPSFSDRSESAISALALERDSGPARFLWVALPLLVALLAMFDAWDMADASSPQAQAAQARADELLARSAAVYPKS